MGLLLSGSAIYLGALAFIEVPIIICDLVASDEPVDHRRAALTIQEGSQPAEMRASWPVKPQKDFDRRVFPHRRDETINWSCDMHVLAGINAVDRVFAWLA
jgi:hypothetical protein